MSVNEVLEWVNEAHGVAYALAGRLEGGAQSGAHLITRPDGSPAVLKWSQDVGWATQVLRAAPVVHSIRERGYPTPEWLAVGTTERGFPYQVQEFVDGSPLSVLDDPTAEMILELVDLQAGMDPDPGRNLSERARDTVFGENRDRLAASGEAGRSVVAAFDGLCRPIREVALPSDDMVHGDLGVENVMARDGVVTGVIDIEAVGSGSRVFDLAKVILHGYVWDSEPSALQRVRQHGEDIAGPDVLRILIGANTYNLLNFGLADWGGIDQVVGPILQLAADL